MPIQTTCPACQASYLLADNLLGKKVRCKKCHQIIIVEAASETAGAEEPQVETGNDPTDLADKIQSEPRRPKRGFVREEEEPERPRRRYRHQEDEDEAWRPRRRPPSNLFLLSAGTVGLALLAGGIVLGIVLSGGGSTDQGLGLDVDVSGPWPTPDQLGGMGMNFPADQTVTLHIAGTGDENTSEAIVDKLSTMVDLGRGHSISSASDNDRMTVLLAPVKDPKAFAGKIDFGTVRSVDGRVITVVARTVEGPPANADPVTKALYQLKAGSGRRRADAARRLKDMLPEEARRKEVAQALEPLLNEADFFARGDIIEALGVWGTKESTPALLKAMNDRDTRRHVIKALGRLKDERAIEPLAQRLEDFFDRDDAAEALQAIGPAAEKAVIKRLHHRDMQVRREAIKILKVIGTRESIPVLEKVVAEKDFFLTRPAEKAIQTIKARAGK